MHPSLLPPSPSYFDPKRRDLAASRYIAARRNQHDGQRERTAMLAAFLLCSLALLCIGAALLTLGTTSGDANAGLTSALLGLSGIAFLIICGTTATPAD